jgi:hypothetical protein
MFSPQWQMKTPTRDIAVPPQRAASADVGLIGLAGNATGTKWRPRPSSFRKAERQADDLGDEENRNVGLGVEPLIDFGAAQIEVGMAHGARDDDGLGLFSPRRRA